MKPVTPSISIRRSTCMARCKAANSQRVAANRTTVLEEESPEDWASMNDVGRCWLNDRTGSTQSPASGPVLRRLAFGYGFSDFGTSRVPIVGNTDSTSDSEGRTLGGTRYRCAVPLPMNRPSFDGEGGIGRPLL